MPAKLNEEQKLVSEITKNQKNGRVATAVLRTDDRILARITDGIYRQPASALRELISNAYDADATKVIIQTDAPRFDQITVRDDGNGMDISALARLIHHIGGSTKRRDSGSDFGVTDKRDFSLSPKGRRLIGKIGIGLFSVSQLTRHFQIITKVKGKDYRLVAEVILRTYTEDDLAKTDVKNVENAKVETGTVRIVSVPADDKQSHGTEIVLMDLRLQSKELLQSRELWNAIDAASEDEMSPKLRIPSYHVGKYDAKNEEIEIPANLPWKENDKPEDRFKSLYQGIIDDIGTVEQRPKLELTLDNYLRTLWTLSLSAPVDYIEKHPFDLGEEEDLGIYHLVPSLPGQAKKLSLKTGETLRSCLQLRSPERGRANHPFKVIVDGIELRRPIRFRDLPQTSQAIKDPMIFVGSASPDLSKISTEERGGDLEFEAYFLWAPKIVPKENNGLLIRINDASGTLFDETFAKYQVSELTRLTQITAEIFVTKGLDAALNIDRESFNTSHPHYQYIMRWVHRALRQLMNTLKQLAADVRTKKLEAEQVTTTQNLEKFVSGEIVRITGDQDTKPIDVQLSTASAHDIALERKKGHLALDADKIFLSEKERKSKHSGKKIKAEQLLFRSQIKAVAQVLDAYGMLGNLTYEEQEELLRAIVSIFSIDKTQ